jgi:hypothetical protein
MMAEKEMRISLLSRVSNLQIANSRVHERISSWESTQQFMSNTDEGTGKQPIHQYLLQTFFSAKFLKPEPKVAEID